MSTMSHRKDAGTQNTDREFLNKTTSLIIEKAIVVHSNRLDMLVNDAVIVEIKTVERILPVHEAQWLSYLRLLDKSVGLLLNFKVSVLTQGIKRKVNNF